MDELHILKWLVAIHGAATWYMVGLIWFVQLVHYPGFASISESNFRSYANRHVRRTGWVVAPPMLVELVSAGLLLCWFPGWWTAVGAAAVAVIWITTALLQVPAHRSLCDNGYDSERIQFLVRSNWIRTVAWSGRGILAVGLAADVLM